MKLKEAHIDVFEFRLDKDCDYAKTFLKNDEIERAERFYFEKHRRRFTIARATMRQILATYINSDPKKLIFNYTTQGKPELSPRHELQFNLSHSGEMALLAVGKTYPLGIDVEIFSSRPYQGIAKQMFSEREYDLLRQTHSSMQSLVFFHIWSQKEAFIKACGLGLTYPTQTFTTRIFPDRGELQFDPLHQKEWQMLTWMPQICHAAALCCEPSIQTIDYIHYDTHMVKSLKSSLR